jgi:hypothetical protein
VTNIVERDKAVGRVLKAVGITDSQVDLVGRILSLEDDKNRVHSVELHHATIGYNGLSAVVHLLNDFRGLEDFRQYLTSHDLPAEETRHNKKNQEYILQNEGVRAQFYVPDFYPKR